MNAYHFDANRRARKCNKRTQALKILEEASETFKALEDREPDWRVIEEVWDTIQACEGLLRKYPIMAVRVGLARVRIKSQHRGDYGNM